MVPFIWGILKLSPAAVVVAVIAATVLSAVTAVSYDPAGIDVITASFVDGVVASVIGAATDTTVVAAISLRSMLSPQFAVTNVIALFAVDNLTDPVVNATAFAAVSVAVITVRYGNSVTALVSHNSF